MIASPFSLKTYQIVFHFYKPFLWISMAITCFQYATLTSQEINGHMLKILLAKLILCGLLFLFYLDVRSKQKLTFYQNFGISKSGLFSISFFMDAFLTIITILVFNLI